MGWNDKAELDKLAGKTVRAVLVAPGEGEMRLVTDDGTLVMSTEGDCCSESWWADAVGVKQLLNAAVTAATEIDMPEPSDADNAARTRQECDAVYAVKITTDHGACDLIFRNSSNGYYGGWANYSWTDANAVAPEGYRLITEDWSA